MHTTIDTITCIAVLSAWQLSRWKSCRSGIPAYGVFPSLSPANSMREMVSLTAQLFVVVVTQLKSTAEVRRHGADVILVHSSDRFPLSRGLLVLKSAQHRCFPVRCCLPIHGPLLRVHT